MKSGWKTAKFKDVSTVVGGSTPKTDIPEYWGGDNYWVAPAELDGGKYISSTVKRITDLAVSKTNLALLPCGTVLLSSRAPIGKVAITTVPMYCNQGFKNIVCGPELFNGFVYYFLKHNVTYLQSLGTGATFKEISKKVVENVSISFPPIEEQQRIVAELDLLTDIIDKKNAQLRDLDTLAQSFFYEMFGDPVKNDKEWPSRPIKESVEEMFLGPFGSALKTDSYVDEANSYCMVYEQKHAIKKTLALDNHFIDEAKFQSLKRFEVRPGDFIMSCRGTIGEIYELPVDAPKGIIHPSLMKIRLKKGVYSPDFFRFVLGKIVAEQNTNGGVVKMAITAKALGSVSIILPPYYLQEKYYDAVQTINAQKACIQESLKQTRLLLDSRMDYYFNE